MALPAAQDEYSLDTDSASDVSTAVQKGARPSSKRNARRHPSHRSATNRAHIRPTQHVAQSQPQIEDEETAHSYREVLEAVREEGAVPIVPRRLRRQHRAFRLTWTATFVSGVLFCQLLAALWLKALAVSASHRTDTLMQKIADTESEIDKTQRKIAVLGNDPQMGTWAAKLGYHQAAQTELDDISKPAAPLAPPIEYSNGHAANASSNDALQPQSDQRPSRKMKRPSRHQH